MTRDDATAEAVRRIRAAKESGQWWLDLGDLPLDRVPDEIAELAGQLEVLGLSLRKLVVDGDGCAWGGSHSLSDGTVRDIGALAGLPDLAVLNLSGSLVSDLEPLRPLARLRWLDLSECSELVELEPLLALPALEALDLSVAAGVKLLYAVFGSAGALGISESSPARWAGLDVLGSLLALEELGLDGRSGIADTAALRRLSRLRRLGLSYCADLRDVRHLADLPALVELDLSRCPALADVGPLREAGQLKWLTLSGCRLDTFSPVRGLLPQLEALYVIGVSASDLHPAVCGKGRDDNALESVRAYYAALAPDAKPDAEIKVFVLGNGRCGKSYLIRRLTGMTWGQIEAARIETTHGATVVSCPAPAAWNLPHPVTLCIWDFGGQDIYHGTHALFLREPAVYLLVYADATENENRFEDGGFTMHNRRLSYWFDYLRQEAGRGGTVNSPVLLVQAQCDLSGEADAPPFLPPREQFPNLSPLIHASAKAEDGMDDVLSRLKRAIKELLREHPQPPLPLSWATVRERVREMQAARSPRTMTLADFTDLCAGCGCDAGDAGPLRDALALLGAVFYREGVFGDCLVVDQSWALDAVYTLFKRHERFQRQIDRQGGRFTHDDLERLIWPEHPPADRRTFLGFMEQCGICFRTTPCPETEYEGAYILPDKLDRWGADHERQFRRQLADDSGVEVAATFAQLHDGIARRFLADIGSVAGDKATYWRYGCHFLDADTNAEALVRTDGNAVRVRAWGDKASELAVTLAEVLKRVPCGQPPTVTWADDADRPMIVEGRTADGRRLTPAVLPKSVFFSYRHPHPAVPGSDRGRQLLRELRELLLADGWTVRFDERELQDGDSISGFVAQVRATAFFVPVFCDRYLDSRYTLSELFAFREALAHDRMGFADRAVPVCFPESGLHDDLVQAEAARRGRAKFADYFRAAEDGALAPRVYEEAYRLRGWSERLGEVLTDLIDRLNTPTAQAVADRLNGAHARLYPHRTAVSK